MTTRGDAVNAKQKLVDNETRQMDRTRRRVCSGCVKAPFHFIGKWRGVTSVRCQLCGTRVIEGAIVVDLSKLGAKPKVRKTGAVTA
jgi:hypothetical protein